MGRQEANLRGGVMSWRSGGAGAYFVTKDIGGDQPDLQAGVRWRSWNSAETLCWVIMIHFGCVAALAGACKAASGRGYVSWGWYWS